jgi:predicted nucleic acid-binding protein
MSKILIDTNIYSSALRGTPDVVAILRKAERIAVSSISIGELFSGFKGGTREQKNRDELAEFLDAPRVDVYPVDEGTAEFYAAILHQLRQQGRPIPTNDIWIAAVAQQQGLTLYSNDAHFQQISGLLLLA